MRTLEQPGRVLRTRTLMAAVGIVLLWGSGVAAQGEKAAVNLSGAMATEVVAPKIAAAIAAAGTAYAARRPAHLVKDIRTEPVRDAGSAARYFTKAGAFVYFQAADPANGAELWRTDGTAKGTRLVKDFSPGRNGGIPSGLIEFQDAVVFVVTNYGISGDLWRSDGTPRGTVPIKLHDSDSYYSSSEVVAGGTLFFVAGAHAAELWRTDGTPEGTRPVEGINPGGPSDVLLYPTPIGSSVLMCGYVGDQWGHGLWRSDGTDAGTVLVKDFSSSGACPSGETGLVRMGHELFFIGKDGMHRRELWKTDGTSAGTSLVADLGPGPTWFGGYLIATDDRLFFTIWDDSGHFALWTSDGTEAGTVVVKSGLGDDSPAALGRRILFVSSDDAHGAELWTSDGTEGGTVLLKDIVPGPDGSIPRELTTVGDLVFFTTQTSETSRQLWSSDGTEAGTFMVKAFPGVVSPGVYQSLTAIGETLFFVADDGMHGPEPWTSDGTEAGTVLLKDIALEKGSYPSQITDVLGTEFFVAADDEYVRDLWRSDGTARGTTLVEDLVPSGEQASFYGLTAASGRLYFGLDRPNRPWAPYASDGTPEGTRILEDASSGPLYLSNGFTSFRGGVLFTAWDETHGDEPRRSDGTPGGTSLLRDLAPGYDSSGVAGFAVTGNRAVFAVNGPDGPAFWTTDGMPQGTALLKKLDSPELSFSGEFVKTSNAVFFVATERNHEQLWRTDGTEAGTVRVEGDATFPLQQSQNSYVPVGDTLFASLRSPTNSSYSLWKTDATGRHLVLVKDNLGSSLRKPFDLVESGRSLFFTLDDGDHGFELWRSDGTAEGTRMVRDIAPGPESSAPIYLRDVHADVEGVLLFAASDGRHGVELWRSDGTERGTRLVQELSPGPASSNPEGFRVSGHRVFFSADDHVHGAELWSGWAAIVTEQPQRAIGDLSDEVRSIHLPRAIENGFLRSLRAAGSAVAQGRNRAAITWLEVFEHSVQAPTGRRFPPGRAAELIELAQQIRGILEHQRSEGSSPSIQGDLSSANGRKMG